MNNTDEELQHRIANKDFTETSADARAYQVVFNALERDPFPLSPTFADTVVDRLESRNASLSKDYFWMAVGLLSFVIGTVVTVMATGFTINFTGYRFISGYAGLLVFGLAFVLVIQYLDKRLIMSRMNS